MPVAVIDLGSNSLKALVAEGPPLRILGEASDATRLSPEEGEPPGELSPRAMREGVAAVERLLEATRRYGAGRTRIVATSMVRDAANGTAFRDAVHARTGCLLEILDGSAEARGIAAGVATDPALANLLQGDRAHAAGRVEWRILDIGGGSLEYIHVVAGSVRVAESRPLGAVRLTRRFLSDPTAPVPHRELSAVSAHVRAALGDLVRADSAAAGSPFVGCSGVFSVCRALLAEGQGRRGGESLPVLAVPELRRLRESLSAMTLAERMAVTGLPATRADIMPVSLTILLEVAALGGVEAFVHSRRSLRHGLASGMLASPLSQEKPFTANSSPPS
ncbi:MAG: hypothetical protein LBV54_05595 [Puniceicoccales bacterium]|jgi:exopolyphosphatase/guanosine-5'-triphosphate,3'-diphosphate pyrophosphatase|nr:hypothetical protein [Puniceicoccales bacterium]